MGKHPCADETLSGNVIGISTRKVIDMTIQMRVFSGLALAAIAAPASAHDLGFAHGHSETALIAAVLAVVGLGALAMFRRGEGVRSAKICKGDAQR